MIGVPSSACGSIFGLLILGDVSDGTLAFPGFILDGMFGATLPSLLAKGSSKLINVTYPPEIETTRQEMKYKKTYKSEIGVLRQKSTTLGTVGGVLLWLHLSCSWSLEIRFKMLKRTLLFLFE